MIQSMQMSEYGLNSLFDNTKYANSDGMSDDSMDRSLSFDETRPMTPIEHQNELEPENLQHLFEQQHQKIEHDTWLITPLPSLISSQKSMIENAPLENLLIEHPSMSVFITQDEINESEEAVEDSSFALIDTFYNNNKVSKINIDFL
jgi:hypothetical protein